LKKFFIILFLFLLPGFSWAQEAEEENPDFIINDAFSDVEEEPEQTIIESMGRSRVTLHASYNFFGGISPGWDELPWYNDEKKFTYILGAKMEALLSLDFQLSQNLKVWNSFYFSIPPDSNSIFTLKEFYFDYDVNNFLFLRVGQYEVAWGISPFYPFTNLPARISEKSRSGDSYIGKLDIPIGIGGLQILGMTRNGFMENPSSPQFNEIAFGTKYNLALQSADIDFGLYYFKEMPFRFFTSVKTTLGKTEMYVEGMASASTETLGEFYLSGNMGIVRDFFDRKVTTAVEVFYNGEPDAFWYRAKEDIREAEVNPLFKGWNGAFSFIIRPGVLGMRMFSRLLYSYDINSLQLVPGISIKPVNLLTATLSVPMALGSRDEDSYYRHNEDVNNRPFSIVLGITINGSFRYRIYMDRSAD
jgi:hypothetical protein